MGLTLSGDRIMITRLSYYGANLSNRHSFSHEKKRGTDVSCIDKLFTLV